MTHALDILSRLVSLGATLGVLAACVWVLRKDTASWRVVVPVMLWAFSVNIFTLVALLAPDTDLSLMIYWSRGNIWLVSVVIVLLLLLHYYIRKVDIDSNDDSGETSSGGT